MQTYVSRIAWVLILLVLGTSCGGEPRLWVRLAEWPAGAETLQVVPWLNGVPQHEITVPNGTPGFVITLPTGTVAEIRLQITALDGELCKVGTAEVTEALGPALRLTHEQEVKIEMLDGGALCTLSLELPRDVSVVRSTPPGLVCPTESVRCEAEFPKGSVIEFELGFEPHKYHEAEKGDEGALALLLALYLGLRTSEVLGLTVGAIDGTTVFVAGTKTKNARRKLALYEPVAKLLARHCAGRPATQRVFAANLPQQPKPDWAYKRLRKACERLEIPQVCPHSLRGLHSSLALEAGATTHQVASALGHASFATTARHYAKRDSIEKGKAKRVADVLHGSSPDPTVEQILARLPEGERQVLLSLIRS